MDRQTTKNTVFMNMAKELASLGTCCRLKVGAILLRKDGSIASGGFNGAPSGMEHCKDETCNSSKRCIHTSHAEENALHFCHGDIYYAYVTHEPCLVCTRMLARRGVKRVYYDKPYSSISDDERFERDRIIEHFGIVWLRL